MIIDPVNFKYFIKNKLFDIEDIISEYKNLIQEINLYNNITLDNLDEIYNIFIELNDIRKEIELYTDTYFCDDDTLIYEDENIINVCIGNTNSDLETIVINFYDITGKIESYLYTNDINCL
jgi:hypothetical protein